MARETPVSMLAADAAGMLYRNVQRLIERDRAITPEERALSGQFHELVKLVRMTDFSRRIATAQLEGYGDTDHQLRRIREFRQGLAGFDAEYTAWVNGLSPAKGRLIIPFGRTYTGYGESA